MEKNKELTLILNEQQQRLVLYSLQSRRSWLNESISKNMKNDNNNGSIIDNKLEVDGLTELIQVLEKSLELEYLKNIIP